MSRDERKLIEKIKKVFDKWLDSRVRHPAHKTIEKGTLDQARIANALALLKIIVDEIKRTDIPIDKDYFKSLSKNELLQVIGTMERYLKEENKKDESLSNEVDSILKVGLLSKHLWSYIDREMHWIAISIMSTSYISSMILMRSIFELIIGISTKNREKMKLRIQSISFLSEQEKDEIYNLWNKLCSWAHPYGKWEKEVCPIFNTFYEYHPKLFQICLKKFEALIDLLFILSIEKYKLKMKNVLNLIKRNHVDLSIFHFSSDKYSLKTLNKNMGTDTVFI